MYIVAVFLFLAPIVLIVVGWNRALRHSDASQSNWRTTCRTTSLLVASIAVARAWQPWSLGSTSVETHTEWEHHPEFGESSTGVFWWTLLSSIVLAIVGKGTGRFFVFGAVVAAVLAGLAVIVLNMD